MHIIEFTLDNPSRNEVNQYIDVLYNLLQKNKEIIIKVKGIFKVKKVCMSLAILPVKYEFPITFNCEFNEENNVCSFDVKATRFFACLS